MHKKGVQKWPSTVFFMLHYCMHYKFNLALFITLNPEKVFKWKMSSIDRLCTKLRLQRGPKKRLDSWTENSITSENQVRTRKNWRFGKNDPALSQFFEISFFNDSLGRFSILFTWISTSKFILCREIAKIFRSQYRPYQ